MKAIKGALLCTAVKITLKRSPTQLIKPGKQCFEAHFNLKISGLLPLSESSPRPREVGLCLPLCSREWWCHHSRKAWKSSYVSEKAMAERSNVDTTSFVVCYSEEPASCLEALTPAVD